METLGAPLRLSRKRVRKVRNRMDEQEYYQKRKEIIEMFKQHQLQSREATSRLKELEMEYRKISRKAKK